MEQFKSLVEEQMTVCFRQIPARRADGEGGFETVFSDGAAFYAAIVPERFSESAAAEQLEQTARYTVTVSRDTVLGRNTIFRRETDGAEFRILWELGSTPPGAGLDMRQYRAERRVLP